MIILISMSRPILTELFSVNTSPIPATPSTHLPCAAHQRRRAPHPPCVACCYPRTPPATVRSPPQPPSSNPTIRCQMLRLNVPLAHSFMLRAPRFFSLTPSSIGELEGSRTISQARRRRQPPPRKLLPATTQKAPSRQHAAAPSVADLPASIFS